MPHLNKRKALNYISAFVMLFLLLFNESAFAQNDFFLTVFGMPQRTFIYNKLEKNHTDLSSISGDNGVKDIVKYPSYTPCFGMSLKYSISKKIFLGYGMQYSLVQQGFGIYRISIGSYVNGKTRLTYLKIPLIFQYNYLVKEKYRCFVSFGPQVSILISTLGAIPVYGQDSHFVDIVHPGGLYKSFTLDGYLTLGGEVKLRGKTFLFIQGVLDCSFTNVENKNYYELVSNNATYKVFQYANAKRPATNNIILGISTGLTFKLR
jgi:hypothetical protein